MKTTKRIALILIFAALALPSSAQGLSGLFKKKAPENTERLPETKEGTSTILQNGDLLQMRLTGPPAEYTQEFSLEMVVDDGTITVPMIGRIKAVGLSSSQLSEAVEKQLKEQKYFTIANININVAPTQRHIIVGGQVRGPGKQPWTAGMTLLAAISSAGGITEYAEDGVRITRDGKMYRFSRKELKADPKKDPKVLPNDHIEVEGEL